MVKKLYPLCENHLFSKAYRKGKNDANRYVAVYVLKSYGMKGEKGIPLTKLGITVNKKLGKAVRRSRVKRIIRAAYRENLPYLKQGFTVIIAARSAAFDKTVKSTDLAPALYKSFAKLEIVDENIKTSFKKKFLNPDKKRTTFEKGGKR